MPRPPDPDFDPDPDYDADADHGPDPDYGPDPGREAAETLALEALAFLLADDDRAADFMAATGARPRDLAEQARDPVFLAQVLDAVLADERLVIAFCRAQGLPLDAPLRARARLPGGADPHWT